MFTDYAYLFLGTTKKSKTKEVLVPLDDVTSELQNLSFEIPHFHSNDHVPTLLEDSVTVSDFECSATDLLELSSIVELIVSRR